VQKLEKVKKEGTDAFSAGNYKEAIEKFTECLDLDKSNNSYNQGILFNRASAHLKLHQREAALKDLNAAIDLNDEYTKAIVKRSELYILMENFEEAVRDLERVKTLDPCKSNFW
jgi:DnaJ family protein C protein 7